MHFTFYDWLLILCVTAFGTVSSFVRDPQIKSVFATVPVPFSLGYLAVGLPIMGANIVGAFLLLAYAHTARILHDRFKWPIVPSIAVGVSTYVLIGAFFAKRVPAGGLLFVSLCVMCSLCGIFLLWKQDYHAGVQYRTPLHPLPKACAIFSVVVVLAMLRHFLLGFTPFFPIMNSVTSYEARHSLATQCRQIPVFLVPAGFMLGLMRYLEVTVGVARCWVLTSGVLLYLTIFIPINAWVRKKTLGE